LQLFLGHKLERTLVTFVRGGGELDILDDASLTDHDVTTRDGGAFAGAKGLDDGVVGIGEQRKRELFLRLPTGLCIYGVSGYADGHEAGLLEGIVVVTKPAGLFRAAGSVGLWVKKENGAVGLDEGMERDLLTLVVADGQVGDGIAHFDGGLGSLGLFF